ncbi:MAG: TonB-dependent receptor plug domain-containing protein [Deltaproteobacteria bacterium]|jgi:outer membrane receptor protein involved in Fe transport|nr:TonB-dependent receptor plug domain-containing protein [Deltaproteobacteria bacterium]
MAEVIRNNQNKQYFYCISWIIGFFVSTCIIQEAQCQEPQAQESPLSTVTVETERPEWEDILSPGSVSVITPDDFKGEQKKLPEYLKAVPGLHVESRGGEGHYTTVTMRGSTAAQVNVYVDGVLQNIGGEGAVDLSLIPMNNVARIEVYRGYAPARFAGAPIGGVINIVTKKPTGLGVSVSAGVKSFNGRNADATITSPLFGGSLLVGAHRDQSDGDFKYPFLVKDDLRDPYCGRSIPCTRERLSNSYTNSDLLVKWQDENWHFKGSWKETKRFLPNDTNYIPNAGLLINGDSPQDFPGINDLTLHRYQKSTQKEFVLGRRQTFGNLDFGIEATYMTQKKAYEMLEKDGLCVGFHRQVGLCWNYYKTERYGIALDGAYNFREKHLLEFRFDYSKEKLTMDGNPKSMEFASAFMSGGYNVNGKDPVTYERENFHAQLSDTILLNESDLWLTLIVRFDKKKDISKLSQYYEAALSNEAIKTLSPTNDTSFITWGVAVKKQINESLVVRASGGTFVRHPTFYEYYGDGATISFSYDRNYRLLIPETGNQWDFAIEWRGAVLGTRANIIATYFARTTENLISLVYKPTNGRMQYINGGHAKARGLELDIGLFHDKFDFQASGTWQETRLLKKSLAQPNLNRMIEGNPLLLQPKWEGHARLTYRPLGDALSIFAEHHYTGRMLEETIATQNSQVFTRRALHVTGAGVRYQTEWGGALTIGVDDLWNNRPRQKYDVAIPNMLRYAEGLRYPSPGRTWYLTLDYSFANNSSSASGGSEADAGLTPGNGRALLAVGVNAASAGSEPGKSKFYVSPRLVFSRNSVNYGPRDVNLGPGSYNNIPGGPYIAPEDAGKIDTFPGVSRREYVLSGAIALGVDFVAINGWPIRLEVEADVRSYTRTKGPGASTYGSVYEASKFQDCVNSNRFGANCVLVGNLENSEQDITSLYSRQHSVFFNIYWDFHNKTRITPFIGAGAGVSFTKTTSAATTALYTVRPSENHGDSLNFEFSLQEEEDRRTTFAWNLTAGISYRVTDNTLLDVAYRYVDSGYEYKTHDGIKVYTAPPAANPRTRYTVQLPGIEINLRKSHQFITGLRFQF